MLVAQEDKCELVVEVNSSRCFETLEINSCAP